MSTDPASLFKALTKAMEALPDELARVLALDRAGRAGGAGGAGNRAPRGSRPHRAPRVSAPRTARPPKVSVRPPASHRPASVPSPARRMFNATQALGANLGGPFAQVAGLMGRMRSLFDAASEFGDALANLRRPSTPVPKLRRPSAPRALPGFEPARRRAEAWQRFTRSQHQRLPGAVPPVPRPVAPRATHVVPAPRPVPRPLPAPPARGATPPPLPRPSPAAPPPAPATPRAVPPPLPKRVAPPPLPTPAAPAATAPGATPPPLPARPKRVAPPPLPKRRPSGLPVGYKPPRHSEFEFEAPESRAALDRRAGRTPPPAVPPPAEVPIPRSSRRPSSQVPILSADELTLPGTAGLSGLSQLEPLLEKVSTSLEKLTEQMKRNERANEAPEVEGGAIAGVTQAAHLPQAMAAHAARKAQSHATKEGLLALGRIGLQFISKGAL